MSYVVASDIEISPSYAIKREQGYPTAAPSPKSTACVGSAEKRASSAVAKGLKKLAGDVVAQSVFFLFFFVNLTRPKCLGLERYRR